MPSSAATRSRAPSRRAARRSSPRARATLIPSSSRLRRQAMASASGQTPGCWTAAAPRLDPRRRAPRGRTRDCSARWRFPTDCLHAPRHPGPPRGGPPPPTSGRTGARASRGSKGRRRAGIVVLVARHGDRSVNLVPACVQIAKQALKTAAVEQRLGEPVRVAERLEHGCDVAEDLGALLLVPELAREVPSRTSR